MLIIFFDYPQMYHYSKMHQYYFLYTFCLTRKYTKSQEKTKLQPALINFGICQAKRVNFFAENSQNLSFHASPNPAVFSVLRAFPALQV
jgi:hypothetical protein